MPRIASFVVHDYEPSPGTFFDDVVQGLSQPAKRLPSKYLYDARGCRLYEAICDLEEYYLTRTELAILQRHSREIAARIGPEAAIIELGSGSNVKTRILLDRLDRPAAYVPVDIARDHLTATTAQLRLRYPRLEVHPLCADFTDWFEPPELETEVRRNVVVFLGSTIGNFDPAEAKTLLARMALVTGRQGGLLLGFDLKKDRQILEAAYNDSRGVTAQFNLNLLTRVNRELGANFRLEQFDHAAIYNPTAGRIEMHLVSDCWQAVSLHGHRFILRRGETICTEHSHKYDLHGFRRRAARAGFRHVQTWTDPRQMFAVAYFEIA